jgi:hypothetical protein
MNPDTSQTQAELSQAERDALNFSALFDNRRRAKKAKRSSSKRPGFIMKVQPVTEGTSSCPSNS